MRADGGEELQRRRGRQAAVLTHRGDGHTVYGQGDSCVDDQVNRYLTEMSDAELLRAVSLDLTSALAVA